MYLFLFLASLFCALPAAFPQDQMQSGLYLSLNINSGTYLQFSDGKTYEINPDDRIYSSFWITPFPAEVGPSGDPDYPVQITNLFTGTVVKGKEVSTQELLKKEEERTKSLPLPEVPKTPPPKEEPTPPKKPEQPKTAPKPQKAPQQ